MEPTADTPVAERNIRDQFAEMYVAGYFMDAGWQVFFPHRDEGFDFIAAKRTATGTFLRPVQVRGCYRTPGMVLERDAYGKDPLKLTQTHPDLVVAMPFFSEHSPHHPHGVAYLRLPDLKTNASTSQYRSQPARLRGGIPSPRPEYRGFFDAAGLARLEADLATLPQEELPE